MLSYSIHGDFFLYASFVSQHEFLQKFVMSNHAFLPRALVERTFLSSPRLSPKARSQVPSIATSFLAAVTEPAIFGSNTITPLSRHQQSCLPPSRACQMNLII